MRKRKKQGGLTDLGVDEAHPTWDTWLLIDHYSATTPGLQIRVAQTEIRRKLLRWQSEELKRGVHSVIPALLSIEQALWARCRHRSLSA